MLSNFPGAYVPLILEGKLIVDRVLASCYGSFDHDLAHAVMLPVRFLPRTISEIFGDENGSEIFVNIAEGLGEWLLPYGQKYGKI